MIACLCKVSRTYESEQLSIECYLSLGGKIHITEMTKNALLGLGGYEISERGLVPIKVR